jgi:hypothetical protein
MTVYLARTTFAYRIIGAAPVRVTVGPPSNGGNKVVVI